MNIQIGDLSNEPLMDDPNAGAHLRKPSRENSGV